MKTPPASDASTRAIAENAAEQEVVAVPILSILPGESPRLNGEDKSHIARLAETEASLPPILVHRPSMQVIDGMHRLMAASMQGRTTINVRFVDGNPADIFLRAVKENVAHGLPLSQADRRAAAERIIGTHPHLSDRSIGEAAGLAAKTVASIRRSSGEGAQPNARVGRDGRVRPLNGDEGRLRAAEILAAQPHSSLREVAKAAGIAPATVLDVRNRLARGEPPLPARPERSTPHGTGAQTPASKGAEPEGQPARVFETGNDTARDGSSPGMDRVGHAQAPGSRKFPSPPFEEHVLSASIMDKLMRDPSLRGSDSGRHLLRLLAATASSADQFARMSAHVPPHCVHMVAKVAQQHAQLWHAFATELDRRGRIIDPAAR